MKEQKVNQNWLEHYPPGVEAQIDPDQYASVGDMMNQACSKNAKAIGFICSGIEMTYGEIDQLAEHFASYLQHKAGLKPGDRIAIMLPNTLQFVISFFAAQKLGLVCVNTNPLYTPREMQHQFKDSGAEAVVILDLFLGKLEAIKDDTGIKTVVSVSIADFFPTWKKLLVGAVLRLTKMMPKHNLRVLGFSEALALGRGIRFQTPQINRDDLCILQYTGGTTGVSKGAMLTHRNILANVIQINEWAKVAREEGAETVLTVLPLYHIFALTVNFLGFMSEGQRIILVPRPIPIKRTVKFFKKYRISILTGVNTLFNSLLNDPEFRALGYAGKIKLKTSMAGGMALQGMVAKEWEKVTGTPVLEGYGLTEASPVTHCNPLNESARLGSIGLPVPSTESRVVDADGKDVAPGEVGELIVRGPQVMKGYWQRPEETNKVLRDGWLWTGDLASYDEQGFYKIVDRKKDMIIVSGFNVFPNEVEDIISSHPKVLEAAVIGVPDEKSGEAIKAFYVPKDQNAQIDTNELEAFCRENLAAYKVPRQWQSQKDLPKSNVGKILRRELRGEPGAAPSSVQFNNSA